ncbi:MAG: hypothetical protein KDC38_01505 [Planctomycetes bacterium]|nr:hypothetical protein [Planctomycetota bacterium]
MIAVTPWLLLALVRIATPTSIWIEGESPREQTMHRHPWWYDQIDRGQLSGGDFISNFSESDEGVAAYTVDVPQRGTYHFWVRANPTQSRLSYRVDGLHSSWVEIDVRSPIDIRNVAADGKVDLRFIAWIEAGLLDLPRGRHTFRFRMHSENHAHGILDCFVLTRDPFHPRGAAKPEELAEEERRLRENNVGWFPFRPETDDFATSAIDLRSLNEERAGQSGFVTARDGRFFLGSGEAVRFWGVNVSAELGERPLTEIRRVARILAKRGVNLVRWHSRVFDETRGTIDPSRVASIHAVVEAMRQEGIYTHLSIFFPLWLRPPPTSDLLSGYDGSHHPFAALFFDARFESAYRLWWKAVLTTPSPHTGRPLTEEPALFGVELVNEDSFLFWTFSEDNIPDPELRELESQFAKWTSGRYGSATKALSVWKGTTHPRDAVDEGRLGLRPLWNVFNERLPRDQDTVRFLVETQRRFYSRTRDHLRSIGCRSLITASNWHTASPRVLGPLERYSYAVGDFIDRHGYFGCHHRGDHASWSIRVGHSYRDRSALRFDPEERGAPPRFAHPAMDLQIGSLPSMISETGWNRPNRYRSEAPLFFATFGALQDSDAIVHFALDTERWTVRPNYFVQPWTLMAPSQMGQFPAAALIYRRGWIAEAEPVVEMDLGLDSLFALEGTPLSPGASLDELRARDTPGPGDGSSAIDPLVHFVGRTVLRFGTGSERKVESSRKALGSIDHRRRRVTSATEQVRLDYGKGLLTLDSPRAQGASGNLADRRIELSNIEIRSPLDLAHIVLVSLDGEPLESSRSMLLQVMTEDRPAGFETEGDDPRVIRSLGSDPWWVREVRGEIRFALGRGERRVRELGPNGEVRTERTLGKSLELRPDVIYYWIGSDPTSDEEK